MAYAWHKWAAGLLVLASTGVATADETIRGCQWRVVDGDTIHMRDYKIRLAGIDAPERKQQCQTATGQDWACGLLASDVLVGLLETSRGTGACVADNGLVCALAGKDRYGRHIGTCQANGIDVQRFLVRAGLAVAEYGDQYRRDEAHAKQAKRGMWGGDFLRPQQWRRR